MSKSFGTFRALEDATIAIKKGEFFSLLGPSGCGKTTLLRIIAGFETPDSGIVTFDEKNIIGIDPNKRQSNTVFQNYALFPHLSVYENVAFPLRIRKVDQKTIDAKVMEYIHLVQLDGSHLEDLGSVTGEIMELAAMARLGGGAIAIRTLGDVAWRYEARTRWTRLTDRIGAIAYGG